MLRMVLGLTSEGREVGHNRDNRKTSPDLVGNEVGAHYEGPLCALRIPNAKHLYLLGPAESNWVL